MDFRTGKGKQSPTFSFCCQAAEVEVDQETGKVRFLKSALAHDCGFALNPMDVEGQIEGSLAMAYGGALNEGLIWDKGQIMNPLFLDYKIPLSADMPEIKTIIVEY